MLMRYQPRDAQSRVSVQQEKLLMGNIERDFNDDRYQIGQVKRFDNNKFNMQILFLFLTIVFGHTTLLRNP